MRSHSQGCTTARPQRSKFSSAMDAEFPSVCTQRGFSKAARRRFQRRRQAVVPAIEETVQTYDGKQFDNLLRGEMRFQCVGIRVGDARRLLPSQLSEAERGALRRGAQRAALVIPACGA